MKRRQTQIVLAALVLGLFVLTHTTTSSAASSPGKFGYFNLQKVLGQSRHAKLAKDEMKKEEEKIKADLDAKAKAIKTARDELDKKKSVMDENAKSKKNREISEMEQEGQKLLQESQAKLTKMSKDLSAPIMDKILEIIGKIGKDEKYDYIFESSSGALAWADDKYDLTKKVVEELDKATLSPKKP